MKPSAPCEDCGARPGQYCRRDCIQEGCKNPNPNAPDLKRNLRRDLQKKGQIGCWLLSLLVAVEKGFLSGFFSYIVSMAIVISMTVIMGFTNDDDLA